MFVDRDRCAGRRRGIRRETKFQLPLGWCAAWAVLCLLSVRIPTGGAEPAAEPAQPADAGSTESPPGSATSGLVRLARDSDVWVDPKKKLVVADGEIVLREGQLEMFACPKGTKEHESVVAVNAKAQYVHAGLLAVGAKAGRTVQFQPQYQAATGTEISIWVLWTDADGKRHKTRAQDWVKNARTGKSLEYPWVFAGSSIWTDETTGEKHYAGDAGDFVCVSNFPTATLDLPVESSQANADLMFAAFTERIPPLGTKVRLVFIPQLELKKSETPAPVKKKAA